MLKNDWVGKEPMTSTAYRSRGARNCRNFVAADHVFMLGRAIILPSAGLKSSYSVPQEEYGICDVIFPPTLNQPSSDPSCCQAACGHIFKPGLVGQSGGTSGLDRGYLLLMGPV